MVFEGEPIYLNVGEVPTPFHMLKVKMTTEKDRMEHVDKAILKPGDLSMPPKAQQPDEGQSQKMDVEHLVNNTSELEVSEGKTRSGRRFQQTEGGVEKGTSQLAPKCPKEMQKRHSLGSSKPVYKFEFSSSQDPGPKRRRFSEPKEQF